MIRLVFFIGLVCLSASAIDLHRVDDLTRTRNRSTAPPKPRKKMVLITGFGGFADAPKNPSGLILPWLELELRNLCPRDDLDYVVKPPLKVEFGSIKELPEFHEASLILSLGVASGLEKNRLRVEVAARNLFVGDKDEALKCNPNDRFLTVTRCQPLPSDLVGKYDGKLRVDFGNEWSCGSYVCNATLYMGCTESTCGDAIFTHMPIIKTSAYEKYARTLAKVYCKIIEHRFPKPAPN